ncbi:Alpha-1,3-mannosyl-glycoprotein 2-beta-N-acetylglucosaminyltransferase, partial [Symbiodinium microadriaticum]
MAACGWNDGALAPFSADPTVVLRSDWFPGAGWLMAKRIAQ